MIGLFTIINGDCIYMHTPHPSIENNKPHKCRNFYPDYLRRRNFFVGCAFNQGSCTHVPPRGQMFKIRKNNKSFKRRDFFADCTFKQHRCTLVLQVAQTCEMRKNNKLICCTCALHSLMPAGAFSHPAMPELHRALSDLHPADV